MGATELHGEDTLSGRSKVLTQRLSERGLGGSKGFREVAAEAKRKAGHEAEEKDGDDIRLDDLKLRQCGLAKHFAGSWWVGSEMTNGSSSC